MGIVDLPMCNFFGKSEESLKHLFIYCKISKNFWLLVTKWLKDRQLSKYLSSRVTYS